MSSQKQPVLKTTLWAYAAVAAFTAISVVVPIIMEKLNKKEQHAR